MLCLWEDFGEEHRHNITANVLKGWKQLKFETKGKHETKSLKKVNKVNQFKS